MAVNQFISPDSNSNHVQLTAPGDGSQIQIADAALLFKGDYSRSGNDLQISGPDGKSVTIEGYFHTGSASTLVGPNGAMLGGDVVEALAGPLFPGQYAQSGGSGQAGNPIGEVQHLEGTAIATRTDGSVVQLSPGTKVYLGDVVETGPDTKFGLSLQDGSLFSMTSDARMVLNEFVFNGDQAQDSSMLVNLVQGAFVFVAGSIAPTGNMKVETPVAVLAIRGTTVGAEIDAQLGSTELSLFQDIDSNKTGEYLVLDKATGEIIGRVTEVGNKLIITGIGETPIIVQKTDQDSLNDLSALELIRAVYAKASGQQGEFENESGSGSFLDIQLVALSGSFTIEELAGNPVAMASAQKIVFDTPDQDDPPVAFFDGFFTDEDDIFAGNVIDNSSIQPDEDPEGFDVRVIGFGEDLIWEEGVDFDFVGGIISPTGSTTFVLSSGAVVEIAANGNFTYNPNPAFDYLADGESAVDSFTYLIADPGNSTDSDTVEVTVFGSNDQPVVVSAQASHEDAVTETAAVQDSPIELVASGFVAFEDLDSTDGHDTVVTNTPVFDGAQWNRADLPAENLGDVFGDIFGSVQLTLTETPSATPDPGASPNPGQVAWEFTIADQDIDFLGAGETLVVTYVVNVQDDSGTSNDTTSQLITVTVTGTNDVPLVDVTASARDVSGTLDEIADLSTSPAELTTDLVETGVITFTDVDLSDQHVTSISGTAVTSSTLANGYVLTPPQITALFDAFTLDDGGVRSSFDSVFGSSTAGDGTVDWTYLISDQDIDFLGANDVVELSFEVTIDDGNGGTVTDTVVITVTGTNDVPVITSAAQAGTVTETADVPGGTDTDPDDATGTISFADVDLSDDPSAVHDGGTVSDSTLANGYSLTTDQINALRAAFSLDDPALGNFSQVNGTGSTGWTYDVANADIDFLGEGDSVELTYVVTISDGNGGSTTQDVVVTVNGINDEPVITSAAQAGTVTETADVPAGTDAEPLEATGTISFTDVDLSDDPSAVHDGGTVSDSTLANGYSLTTDQINALRAAFSLDDPALGNFSQVNGTGSTGWTYDVANADIDFLGEGDNVELTYVVTISDGNGGSTTQNVVVTVNGTNDEPVITSAAQAGTVTETADVPAGTDAEPLEATGTISFTDVDLSDDPSAVHDGGTVSDSTLANGYSLTTDQINALRTAFSLDDTGLGNFSQTNGTGSTGWTYDVANADIDFLGEGDSVELTYVVTISDGNGGSTTQNVVVTVNGTNDEPVISGAEVNATELVEAGFGVTGVDEVSGDVSGAWSDVDQIEADLLAVTEGAASGDAQSALTFDGVTGEAEVTGTYGSLFIKADGSYRYVLDNADADTQALTDGQSVTDSFNYTIANGPDAGDSVTSTITVDITGTNDQPVVSAAEVNGTGLVEAGFGVAGVDEVSGDVSGTWSDVDQGEAALLAVTQGSASGDAQSALTFDGVTGEAEVTGAYGSLFIKSDGSYRYVLDNADADTQALTDGQSVTDSFNYTIANGPDAGDSVTSTIAVDITGTNDQPVVSAAEVNGTGLVEAGFGVAGVDEVSGDVSGAWSDIDQGEAALLAVTQGSAGGDAQSALTFDGITGEAEVTGTYGSLFIKADGTYRYVLDNADADTQALTDGQSVTDSFNYTIANGPDAGDSTTSTIGVDITGTNDQPVISTAENASGIVEAGTSVPGVSEVTGDVSGTWSDIDQGEAALLAVTQGSAGTDAQSGLTFDGVTGEAEVTGTYGSLFIKADGTYRYVLDDADADTEALADGQTVTDSFNYTIANGAETGDAVISAINIEITGSADATAPVASVVTYDDIDLLDNGILDTSYLFLEDDGGFEPGTPGTSDVFDVPYYALDEVAPPGEAYTIASFTPTEDALDLSILLSNAGYVSGSSSIEDYVQFVDDGTNTTVQFDADGAGTDDGYVDLAVLDGVTGASDIKIIDTSMTS